MGLCLKLESNISVHEEENNYIIDDRLRLSKFLNECFNYFRKIFEKLIPDNKTTITYYLCQLFRDDEYLIDWQNMHRKFVEKFHLNHYLYVKNNCRCLTDHILADLKTRQNFGILLLLVNQHLKLWSKSVLRHVILPLCSINLNLEYIGSLPIVDVYDIVLILYENTKDSICQKYKPKHVYKVNFLFDKVFHIMFYLPLRKNFPPLKSIQTHYKRRMNLIETELCDLESDI